MAASRRTACEFCLTADTNRRSSSEDLPRPTALRVDWRIEIDHTPGPVGILIYAQPVEYVAVRIRFRRLGARICRSRWKTANKPRVAYSIAVREHLSAANRERVGSEVHVAVEIGDE